MNPQDLSAANVSSASRAAVPQVAATAGAGHLILAFQPSRHVPTASKMKVPATWTIWDVATYMATQDSTVHPEDLLITVNDCGAPADTSLASLCTAGTTSLDVRVQEREVQFIFIVDGKEQVVPCGVPRFRKFTHLSFYRWVEMLLKFPCTIVTLDGNGQPLPRDDGPLDQAREFLVYRTPPQAGI